MNKAARYNLQKGIKEDKRYKHTSYNKENAVDAFILARMENKKLLLDNNITNDFIDEAGEEIAAAAYNELEKLFKNLK